MGSAPAGLIRRNIVLAGGSPLRGRAGAGGELWFMIAGSGRLAAGALRAAVRADTGCWIPPSVGYRLDCAERVLLDAVALPAAAGSGEADRPLLSELAACEVERTGDRKFRVLLGPGRGCEAATQFVGEIPPGRAPEHSHPYDEVVLVLHGEGVAHAGGSDRALTPGTTVHLPRGMPHCLENTGRHTLTVLGVFHPGGSPAAKNAGTP
jgi:mannose-6-phosphate isomerase-like protein (cupin superfamily)